MVSRDRNGISPNGKVFNYLDLRLLKQSGKVGHGKPKTTIAPASQHLFLTIINPLLVFNTELEWSTFLS